MSPVNFLCTQVLNFGSNNSLILVTFANLEECLGCLSYSNHTQCKDRNNKNTGINKYNPKIPRKIKLNKAI